MRRSIVSTLLSSVLFILGFSTNVNAQPDLVVQKSDVSIVKSVPLNATFVTVTVHNPGSVGSGAFVLRIGVSAAGAIATSDHPILGLGAGQSVSRTGTFQGTDWPCAWGNADAQESVEETSEANNFANENAYTIAIIPGGLHDQQIGVVNPGSSTETALLTAGGPPDWIATVYPDALTLAPGELATAVVRIGAPAGFDDYALVKVFCNFQDGTPGTMDWNLHMETAIPVEDRTWGAIKALFED